MEKPLHEALLCGQPLRFFAPPNKDGRPDYAWHAHLDLLRAMGLSPEEAEFMLRHAQAQKEASPLQTIATSDGVVIVGPHYCGQGAIGAMIELRKIPASTMFAYFHEAVIATNRLPGSGRFEWWFEAQKRWN